MYTKLNSLNSVLRLFGRWLVIKYIVVKLGLKPRGRSHKPFWIPIYTSQDDTTD